MSEMELSLRLYRQGNEEAWRFVMFTDVGMENMDAIRDYTGKLLSGIDERSAKNLQDIEHTLSLSRIGIATVTALGVLGFSCTCARPTRCSRPISASRKSSVTSATALKPWCANARPR